MCWLLICLSRHMIFASDFNCHFLHVEPPRPPPPKKRKEKGKRRGKEASLLGEQGSWTMTSGVSFGFNISFSFSVFISSSASDMGSFVYT